MSAREQVLAAVRRAVQHSASHPGAHPAAPLDAGFGAFATSLAEAGGEAHGPFAPGALGAAVLAHARSWSAGGRIVAEPDAAAWLGPGPFEVAREDALPHDFADVAVAIARGVVGVAENGAVALCGREAPHRSLLFLAERVILLLDAAHIAGELGSAFRALPPGSLGFHHLTWISGPSKTADIEQTLVLGAHGPRALAVFARRE
jgi:L-lactate dehydrogenase complex protein LldG